MVSVSLLVSRRKIRPAPFSDHVCFDPKGLEATVDRRLPESPRVYVDLQRERRRGRFDDSIGRRPFSRCRSGAEARECREDAEAGGQVGEGIAGESVGWRERFLGEMVGRSLEFWSWGRFKTKSFCKVGRRLADRRVTRNKKLHGFQQTQVGLDKGGHLCIVQERLQLSLWSQSTFYLKVFGQTGPA